MLLLLCGCLLANAQEIPLLKGNTLRYKGKKIQLNEKNLLVDGTLQANDPAPRSPYAFATFNEAVAHLEDGSAQEPMTIYIAPNVYWVDDPDDPAIREPQQGGTPYALEIACNGLRLIGLADNPEDVVLACNRGQTQGAVGNFTMFRIEGDDVSAENITFGNYCNVDLVYPRNPALNRPKRMDAIVQAQLILNKGDRYAMRNCRFISRLNLCPCNGGERTLFDHCHFESTDDALCGTGVYVDCDFVFYGAKPFYSTYRTGAVMYRCSFDVRTLGAQYFTKAGGPMTVIDSEFHTHADNQFVGWTPVPTPDERSYQYRMKCDGKTFRMHPNQGESWLTVDLTGKKALEAYLVTVDGKEIYNIYNLLRGDDDWDPMNLKKTMLKAEKKNKTIYTNRPTMLTITPKKAEIESSVNDTTLTATFYRFGYYADHNPEPVQWSVMPPYEKEVQLFPKADGRCKVTPTATGDETHQVVVKAVSASGLESAATLTVKPKMLAAPVFLTQPSVSITPAEESNLAGAPGQGGVGFASVKYTIDLQGRADQSVITWYRCDANGDHAIEVAESRLNEPEQIYRLKAGDVGYYLMAVVRPKHLRCEAGVPAKAVSTRAVTAQDVCAEATALTDKHFSTDFQNFPTTVQPMVKTGFWTVDAYKPLDTREFDWQVIQPGCWFYGKGTNGASHHYGLLQGRKGARLMYTPVGETFGDMTLTLKVDPAKTAGQGFGSATGQYLDVCLKMDTRTLTGYGLRIIRTPANDSAVDFYLIEYSNGTTKALTEAVSASCYLSTCTIHLIAKGDKLTAMVDSDTTLPRTTKAGILKEVSLQTTIRPNTFGGVAIQHTGSQGDSATQLRKLEVDWK